MKKSLLIILLLPISYMAVQAQGLRLNGYVNYTFDDKFETYNNPQSYFNGTIKGGLQWGAGLEYMTTPELGIAVTYFRQDTQIPINYWNPNLINPGEENRVLEAAINYIMGGTTGYLSPNPKIEGYGGLMLGIAIYDNKMPIDDEPSGATKFAWGLKLGANIWLAEQIGLKLQAHMLSAVQAFGGGFYFGTGGVSTGVSSYSTLLSFSLGGGLVFKLSGGE